MDHEKVLELLERYDNGTSTDAERAAVEGWYNSYAERNNADAFDDDMDEEMMLIWHRIQADREQVKVTKFRYGKLLAYAAAIAVVLSVGLLFYNNTNKTKQDYISVTQAEVKPGKIGATLTLANGKRIALSDAANGELATESGVVIKKAADGQLIYEIQSQVSGANEINTISTAKGETYRLRLPDGTWIWLNAASSLSYAPALKKDGLRTIKLIGEAYFEVAKDKMHPFIVETSKQKIEVLGTHFNVNAYSDEALTRTTLLEGAVLLNHSTILKPGQQGTINASGKINIEMVDVAEAIAWKNGKFIFNSEDISSVMRKLSRWYDVEVVYEGNHPETTFTGVISRYDNISKILDKINSTGAIHLKLEGRRIVIMP
ncbi:FecR family protein [Pedobacter frigoris]|uniref:FecR family protein n=1 Tax=Pedobacter frigoris TaxID=2571272 RepID=UPI00292F4A00|nr:FecR domain-containing protein [Pedobacter frigoris]